MRPLLRPVLLVTAALTLAVLVTVGAAGLLGRRPDPATRCRPVARRRAGHGRASTRPPSPTGRTWWRPCRPASSPPPRTTARGRPWRWPTSSRPAPPPTPPTTARPDSALARAEQLAPGDSVLLTARGALAAARHDFRGALRARPTPRCGSTRTARRPRRSGPTPSPSWAGTTPQPAPRSNADDLDPGPSTFARLSYQAELRGDLRRGTPTDAPVAWRQPGPARRRTPSRPSTSASCPAPPAGRRAAAHYYRNALDADPTYLPALAGRARLAVARGDIAAAERDYTRVVQRLPLTEYVVELGELYQATGRPQLAEQQYAVATATARLFAANGVSTDLETAVFQADHGSPADALARPRAAEWCRAALDPHRRRAGLGAARRRSRPAGPALRRGSPTRLGTPDARLLFHRGAVEAALGLPAAAATPARRAVGWTPGSVPGARPAIDDAARRCLR